MRDLRDDRTRRSAPTSTLERMRRVARACRTTYLHAEIVREHYALDDVEALVAAGAIRLVGDRYELGAR